MKKWTLLLAIAIPLIVYAEIYQWTDSQGIPNFSDQPHEKAEKMDLPEIQVLKPPPSTPEEQSSKPQSQEENAETMPHDLQNEQRHYDVIEIVSPQHEATIWNNQATIDIQLHIEPELQPGHQIIFRLDGKPVGEPVTVTSFHLVGVNPGTHALTAQIINSDKHVLASSHSVTFYLHRHRVKR